MFVPHATLTTDDRTQSAQSAQRRFGFDPAPAIRISAML
jgi:hypothetical protein